MDPALIGIILIALQALRSRLRPCSAPELYEYLSHRTRNRSWPWYVPWVHGAWPLDGKLEEGLALLERHLHGMEILGLAVRAQVRDADDETTRWRSTTIDELNGQVQRRRRDGGGNGRDPGGRRGGGGDGGDGPGPGDDIGGNSGGGIREVLSHPYLFALPTEEFDTLVDDMFIGAGAP